MARTHAVPAIMTGHLRRGDVLPQAQDYPPSVFDRLGESWDFHVHEPATNFCTPDLCSGVKDSWPERSRQLLRDVSRIMKDRLLPGEAATEVVTPPETISKRKETVEDWMAGIRGGRTMNLLHIELPHFPWQYDASGGSTTTPGPFPASSWSSGPRTHGTPGPASGVTWLRQSSLITSWER